MLPEKGSEYSKTLLDLIPTSGENIGNWKLREQLRNAIATVGDELTEQEYWSLRDDLIDQGVIQTGRGKGGSVHRVAVEAATPAAVEMPATTAKAEAQLYEPFQKAITSGYVKDNRIKRFVSEITAQQGRRATGGKWSRPDFTLIAVRTYSFTPGKRLEVITFEIKPSVETAFEGIYEALAHQLPAHRSYLAACTGGYADDDEIPDQRIVQECSRLGIGYMTFSDPSDYDTYVIVNTAKLNERDPYDVDQFITTQITAENQAELREWLS